MQKYENTVQILAQGEPFLAKEKEPEKERYRLFHLRGSTHFRMQRYADAVNDLASAIRISGNEWSDYSQLGASYYQLNRHDEVIQALQRASALNPGQSVNTDLLGKAYFKKGIAALSNKQYADAIDNLRRAREFDPKDGYIYYNLAEAFLFQKIYVEAEKALNQALEIMPKSPEVFQRRGLVYEKQKKWDQSLSAYQKAFEGARPARGSGPAG